MGFYIMSNPITNIKINLEPTNEQKTHLDKIRAWQRASNKSDFLLGVHSSQWPDEMKRHNEIVWNEYDKELQEIDRKYSLNGKQT